MAFLLPATCGRGGRLRHPLRAARGASSLTPMDTCKTALKVTYTLNTKLSSSASAAQRRRARATQGAALAPAASRCTGSLSLQQLHGSCPPHSSLGLNLTLIELTQWRSLVGVGKPWRGEKEGGGYVSIYAVEAAAGCLTSCAGLVKAEDEQAEVMPSHEQQAPGRARRSTVECADAENPPCP